MLDQFYDVHLFLRLISVIAFNYFRPEAMNMYVHLKLLEKHNYIFRNVTICHMRTHFHTSASVDMWTLCAVLSDFFFCLNAFFISYYLQFIYISILYLVETKCVCCLWELIKD